MPRINKKNGKDWQLWSLWLPRELKDHLTNASIKTERPQSEIIRDALITYLGDIFIDQEDFAAIEIISRKRKERIRMIKPRDGHDARMLPIQVSSVIKEEKQELEKLGLLEPEDFDHFIELINQNREAIKNNPYEKWINRKLDLLVEKLQKEQKELIKN